MAGKQYEGDGLSVTATPEGARLRCVFQRMEGRATSEGLWLTSTVTNAVNDRLRVVAAAVECVTRSTVRNSLPATGTVKVRTISPGSFAPVWWSNIP